LPSTPTPSLTPIILAGGLGTRLKSVTGELPKVLAEVRGRPFLTYLLDWIRGAGFARACISIGYGAEAVMDVLGDAWRGLGIDYSREYERLGTGGGVKLALSRIESEGVLVMNGDSAVDVPLADFVRFAAQGDGPALLAVKVPDTARYGSLDIEDGVVRRFLEKGRTGQGWINAGVYYFPKGVVEALPEGASSLETDLLQKAAGSLRAMQCDAPFLDIGTPEDFARAADAAWFDRLGGES